MPSIFPGEVIGSAMIASGRQTILKTTHHGCVPRAWPLRFACERQAHTLWRNQHQRLAGATAKPTVPLAAGSADGDHRLQRLEAVLFLSKEPLTTRKLSQYANLADATEARTLIRRLNEVYDARGRSFRAERVAGGYQLLTRGQFATWVRRLQHVPHETRLSAPALETLAVVAYRQPVLRAEIEAIRGVACGEILRQLMERDLVRIGGRSEELGRPYLYTTTKQFLLMFGLDNVESLPRVEFMRTAENEVVDSRHESGTSCPRSSKAGELKTTQKEEELEMPMGTKSGLDREEMLVETWEAEPVVSPVSAFDEEDDDYDEFYEDDDDFDDDEDEDEDDLAEDLAEDLDEEADEEFVEEEELEEEEDDDFDDENQWEEVDDEDDEDDWDDDDDWDDEEEDDDEDDWD